MKVIELIEEMCDICEKLRQRGHRIRFVPTMGALHDGHTSLIQRANTDRNEDNYKNHSSTCCSLTTTCHHDYHQKSSQPKDDFSHHKRMLNFQVDEKNNEEGDNTDCRFDTNVKQQKRIVVIVSIFVNPKQFNSSNDFDNYPKDLDSDLEICGKLNVDYVFAPKCGQMYPTTKRKQQNMANNNDNNNNGYSKNTNKHSHCIIQPPANKLAQDLEGKSRPGHFEGMLTVVCKLFNIIKPHDAYFGEKDYQQLILVRNMVENLNMDIQIKGAETIRDLNLLPLSSRNVRLKEKERKFASVMYKILSDAKDAIESAQSTSRSINDCMPDDKLDILDSSIGYKDLNTIILASMLTTLTLNLSDDNLDMINVNYLELRCAKDITEINYVENCDFEGFDCENGCVTNQLNLDRNSTAVLKARLLTSIIIGNVRLLDNIEVLLNYDDKR